MSDSLSFRLKEASEKYRDAIAVRENAAGETIATTYAGLWREVERIQARLGKEDAADRGIVGIWGHRNRFAIASVIACLHAGYPFLPLNRKYPAARIRNFLREARCRRVLDASGSERFEDVVGQDPAIEVMDLTESAGGFPPGGAGPMAPTAYVIGTSGSTGNPKLIPISRENLWAYLENSPEKDAYGRGERVSQAFDLSFDPAIGEILHAFLNGSTLCPLADSDFLFLGEYFRRERVDRWFSTPSTFKLALATDQFSEPEAGLKSLAFIGESLDPSLVAACEKFFPGAEIWNVYGPAECTIAVSRARVDGLDLKGLHSLPLGRFFPEVSHFIEAGELFLAGPQVFSGYLSGAPAAFSERDGRRYFATGDLVTTDAHGAMYFAGRKDHQIKLLGQRVECEELEGFFQGMPGTFGVACVPWPRDESGAALGIVLAFWGEPNEGELQRRVEECKRHVPAQWVPKAAYVFDRFPLSEHKKTMRNSLIESVKDGDFEKEILL